MNIIYKSTHDNMKVAINMCYMIRENVQISVAIFFVYTGTFVPKDKVLQMMQINHEKELTSYKQTICRLEENNRQMLEEINNLKQTLELHQSAIDLQIEACGWNTDLNIQHK